MTGGPSTVPEEPFEVYDFRHDVRNVVVTPEVRGRFLRMEPGEVGPFHSHDVGHEVFIVLEGQAEFEIEGQRRTLGPGQCCFARAGEPHEVRVVGEEPMTLFLSVTPHTEPTHTFWEDGRRLPPVYGYWTPAGLAGQPIPTAPLPELAASYLAMVQALGEAVSGQGTAAADSVARLGQAVAGDDLDAAKAAVDELWAGMRATHERFVAVMTAWNELALRMGQIRGNG